MIRIAVVVLVVVATVAAWPAGALAEAARLPDHTSSAETSPGTAFSGAIAVHESDLEGEVEARSLELALARADGSATPTEARATVLADRLASTRDRIQLLEQRRLDLVEAHAKGDIGDRAFRVRAAALAAEARAHERLLARSRTAAADLPTTVRHEHGLANVTYRSLLDRTGNVTAGEFGDALVRFDVGTLAGWNGIATWNGTWSATPSWNATWNESNTSDDLQTRLDRSDRRVDSLRANRSMLEQYDDGDDEAVQEALTCARDELNRAAASIRDARAAADRDDEAPARQHLDVAESHLRRAAECLAQGWEAATDDDSSSTSDSERSSWNESENWTYDSSKSF